MKWEKKLSTFCLLVLPLFLVIVFLTISGSLAKQMTSTSISDFARVAEFDIEIIPPEELAYLSENDSLRHTFTGKEERISFDFKVINHDEADVICTPYFEGNVTFYVYVEGVDRENFIVEIGEAVDFTIEIIPDGLKSEVLAANLVVNVKQFKEEVT